MQPSDNPFLNDVVQNPDTDDARLVYADWLEERGDPRGAFIRAQCIVANSSECDEEYYEAFEEQDQLLGAHGEAWVEELQQDLKKAKFRRGFIEEVTILASRLAKDGGQLLERAPIHWLRLNRVKGKGEALAGLPALANLRGLDISGLVIPNEDMDALFQSPYLTNLVRFKARHYDYEKAEGAVASLAESGKAGPLEELEVAVAKSMAPLSSIELPHLRALTLESFESEFVEPELVSFQTPHLTSLTMVNVQLMPSKYSSTNLPWDQLQRLSIDAYNMPRGAIAAMEECGAFREVERLALRVPADLSQELSPVFQLANLANCRELELRFVTGELMADTHDVSDESVVLALLAAEQLNNLRDLRISGLPPGALSQLIQLPAFQQLEHLRLYSSELTRDDMVALAGSPLGTSLKRVGFISSNFGPGAVEELAASELPNVLSVDFGADYGGKQTHVKEILGVLAENAFPRLHKLGLDWIGGSGRTLEQLAKLSLPELRILSFQNNNCSQASIQTFLDQCQCERLFQLRVWGSVTTKNVEKFTEKFGTRVRLDAFHP